MRRYTELLHFLVELSDGLLDHLPEEQRIGQLTVAEIVARWMANKSYFAAVSLRKDIVTYADLSRSGDYSVDQLLSDMDLDFVSDRFGCDVDVYLSGILGLIDFHTEKKRKDLLLKYIGWLGYQ